VNVLTSFSPAKALDLLLGQVGAPIVLDDAGRLFDLLVLPTRDPAQVGLANGGRGVEDISLKLPRGKGEELQSWSKWRRKNNNKKQQNCKIIPFLPAEPRCRS